MRKQTRRRLKPVVRKGLVVLACIFVSVMLSILANAGFFSVPGYGVTH